MNYIQVTLNIHEPAKRDIAIALLGDDGYDGFEETEEGLNAFIPKHEFDEATLTATAVGQGFTYTVAEIAEKNWNEQWESDFEPVVVPGFCTVRADFHKMTVDTPYEVVITPKMSFGTGHHATTFLMMQQMQHIDFNGASVLDFGTGTGILAILADKLGAAGTMAIDNDEWAYNNALENIPVNNAENVKLAQGSIEIVAGGQYKIILANVNRHILVRYMQDMYTLLLESGTIIMSGLLTEDEEAVIDIARQAGFIYVRTNTSGNWISLIFNKA